MSSALATAARILVIACVVTAAFGDPAGRARRKRSRESGTGPWENECPCDPGQSTCHSQTPPEVCPSDPTYFKCDGGAPDQDGCPPDSSTKFCTKHPCHSFTLLVKKGHGDNGRDELQGILQDDVCTGPGGDKVCKLTFTKTNTGWVCDGDCQFGRKGRGRGTGVGKQLCKCIEVTEGAGNCIIITNKCDKGFKSWCFKCNRCKPCQNCPPTPPPPPPPQECDCKYPDKHGDWEKKCEGGVAMAKWKWNSTAPEDCKKLQTCSVQAVQFVPYDHNAYNLGTTPHQGYCAIRVIYGTHDCKVCDKWPLPPVKDDCYKDRIDCPDRKP